MPKMAANKRAKGRKARQETQVGSLTAIAYHALKDEILSNRLRGRAAPDRAIDQ